ncbi:hypothetical protein NM680_20785 [Paracoccus sp. PS-1]|uniref:hypothetical protein n=1 Tax=Paracoccus sp. PS1 TaxID=2963938 RepID=UPI0027E4C21B|nr:hypothetical protein [Paracoccus sp. PS1]MDQ7264224.1 hypothetical protein [Paracoccus sp. PS1]
MQAPLSPVPPGLIADLCLRDLSRVERFRSAKRDWQMKPLPSLPERPAITLERTEYREIRQ